jgi:hypothetical protein
MFADRGLGQTQGLLDFTNTHFLMLEQLDHLDPVGVGQGFHNLDKRFHGVSISMKRNIMTRKY